MEVAALATTDHGIADIERREATQAQQGGNDRGNVADLVLGQIASLRAWIGDELLALALIKFLSDGQSLLCRPAPALATGLLQRRQVK
jgi:hypothetical protein